MVFMAQAPIKKAEGKTTRKRTPLSEAPIPFPLFSCSSPKRGKKRKNKEPDYSENDCFVKRNPRASGRPGQVEPPFPLPQQYFPQRGVLGPIEARVLLD